MQSLNQEAVDNRVKQIPMDRLNRIDDDIWTAEGPTVSFFGVPYPTRMVLVRLPEGLWAWSPVALDDALKAEVDALGPVRWLVEPNKIHHLFLGPWLAAFPEARAYAPPGLAARKPEIPFAGELGDTPEPEWAEWIDQVVLRGSPVLEEVIFFHRPSASCIIGDLIQRHDPEAYEGWLRWLMEADDLVGEHGSTPREWRATFLRREPARAAAERARAWKPRRLLIAHGACALEDGQAVLEEGLSWTKRPWPL
jgi:hypothetical protein